MSYFVVIEGLDGAGTTSQTKLFTQYLHDRNVDVIATREPSDGPIGTLTRQMLSMRVVSTVNDQSIPVDRQTLALMFAADRLDHVQNEIDPALASNVVVVSDRYALSSYVYQGDVDDDETFDIEWVQAINSRARKPDLTLFLETPVDVCLSRLTERAQRDIYETREKLTRLEKRYRQTVDKLLAEGEHIVVIDGTQPMDDVHRAIVAAFDSLKERNSKT